MVHKEAERRTCERFVVPGATVYCKEEGFFFLKKYADDFYPVFDISLGGLRYLSQKPLKDNTKVSLKIVIPGEDDTMIMKGKVKWVSPNTAKSYKYIIGIQFEPYGTRKGNNDPESLKRLEVLEQKAKSSEGRIS
jgi:Tfp pilus assembly protein PilZ